MTDTSRPCAACPWMSRDPRDVAAVSDETTQDAMRAGTWFCCHVNLGTCHGARIRHAQHQRQQEATSG